MRFQRFRKKKNFQRDIKKKKRDYFKLDEREEDFFFKLDESSLLLLWNCYFGGGVADVDAFAVDGVVAAVVDLSVI